MQRNSSSRAHPDAHADHQDRCGVPTVAIGALCGSQTGDFFFFASCWKVLVKLAEISQRPAEPCNFLIIFFNNLLPVMIPLPLEPPTPQPPPTPPQPRHLITVSLSGESVTMETGAEAAEGGGRKRR